MSGGKSTGKQKHLEPKVPGGKSTWWKKFLEAKVPGGKSTGRQKFLEAKVLGGKSTGRQKYRTAKVPGGNSSFFRGVKRLGGKNSSGDKSSMATKIDQGKPKVRKEYAKIG